MELGNLLFGHSRGAYRIPRGEGFEEEFYRLLDAYAPDRDNSWREYGEDYENDVFVVRRYYWGDCTCGFEDKLEEWEEHNQHKKGCYQDVLRIEMNKWLEDNPEPQATLFAFQEEDIEPGVKLIGLEPKESPDVKMWREWCDKKERFEKELYDRLCSEFGLDRSFGWAAHCTCDYYDRLEEFYENNSHDETCPVVLPNFLFKPDGFFIMWYKYPFRDSYSNREITLSEFRKIIDACIASLDTERGKVNKMNKIQNRPFQAFGDLD